MGKLVVSLDGVVIKEVQITKDKTTLGRRPYNDIVIDNLAVSGEHAVLQMLGSDVFIEDLNSTNGTYINGKAVKKQLLAHNDTIEIGKYKIRFLNEAPASGHDKTVMVRPGTGPAAGAGGATVVAAAGPASSLAYSSISARVLPAAEVLWMTLIIHSLPMRTLRSNALTSSSVNGRPLQPSSRCRRVAFLCRLVRNSRCAMKGT